MEFLSTEFKEWVLNETEQKQQGLHLNIFELLHTPEGFDALQKWFYRFGGSEIDEYTFTRVLKATCKHIKETQTWEVFDTISNDSCTSIKEFCLIVFILSAAECKQLRALLYMHGKAIYSALAGSGTNEICFERTKRLGRVLGMNERYLIQKGREFGFGKLQNPSISFEHFQLFYFDIFSELDYEEPSEYKETEQVTPKPEVKPTHKKKTSKCVGCKSKHCLLL